MAADFVILMLVMNIGMYFVDVMAGMWFTLFFAVYVIAAAVLYYRQRPQVINELITFATEYGQVQKHLIQERAALCRYGFAGKTSLGQQRVYKNHREGYTVS